MSKEILKSMKLCNSNTVNPIFLRSSNFSEIRDILVIAKILDTLIYTCVHESDMFV